MALPSGTPPTHPLSAGAQGRPRNQGRPRQRGPQRREGESPQGKTGRRGHVCFCTGPSPWSKVPSAKGEQSAPGPPRRPRRGPAAPAPAVGMRISAAAPSATRPAAGLAPSTGRLSPWRAGAPWDVCEPLEGVPSPEDGWGPPIHSHMPQTNWASPLTGGHWPRGAPGPGRGGRRQRSQGKWWRQDPVPWLGALCLGPPALPLSAPPRRP